MSIRTHPGPARNAATLIGPQPKATSVFYAQAAASFAISLLRAMDHEATAGLALAVGSFYLPVGGWIRGFLALGLLYVVTFTPAKCVRDAQEAGPVVRRVDQAPFTPAGV